MKNHFQTILIFLAVFAGFHRAVAVTFSINPSVISNTYNGNITLQITGLSDGDSVVVRKFLDANTNGVLDAGDILWQEFQMTDGQSSVFTNGTMSVTNFNVPCDTDGSANGTITATLYPAQDVAQLVVGEYLFVLTSPAGHFSPVTNSFAVTNFPFAQFVSGNVVNNGTNVPNAIVLLFQPSPGGGQNPQAGVVANNSGAYKIATAAGAYVLGALKTNYVSNLAVSPSIVLNQGTIVTTNVPLTNATESISGRLVDASSGAGLAGCLVPIESTNDLLAVAFTDTNGNFSAGVTSNQWKVENGTEELIVKGYLASQSSIKVNTTNGSVSGVTESLTKGSAIFYGTVEDASGNPLTGTEIRASDNDDLYQADGVVFANGNYVTSAVGGGGDQWQVQYDGAGPANYIYSQPAFNQNGGTNINVGQAIQVNITGLLATNFINGTVEFNGNPVVGVGVFARATISNANFDSSADTAADGSFSLNVGNGTWTVGINCSEGNDSLQNILGENFQCPNNVTVVINNSNAGFNFTVPPVANDDQIIGHVNDNTGNPVAGVNVYANNGAGTIYTNTTDSTGYYSFFVMDGTWTMTVDCGQLNNLGYSCADNEQLTTCCGYTDEGDFTVYVGSQSGYFGYSVENGQVTINSYTGPGGAVMIPDTISNLPVVSIGNNAFLNSSMTSVMIPDGIISIGDSAFLGTSLTSLTIPNSVMSIGIASFADCFSLVSVSLGTNVTSLGDAVFGSCHDLASITIPASVTSIGDDPFVGCSSLPAITVDPNNPAYASVGGVLFNHNLTSLIQYPAGNTATEYTLPASVNSIGDYAFYSCNSLGSVTVGSNVNTIGSEAFAFSQDLTNFYFLGSAPTTDPSAFQGTSNGYLDATIYYLPGTTGWTSPFQGLPTVMLSGPVGLPQLDLVPYSGNAVLIWPTNATGFGLQSCTNLTPPADWINVTLSPILIGGQNVVIMPMSSPQQFYRLKH